VVEGVAPRSIPTSTCGRPPSRWCANGSSAISAPPDGSRTSRGAPARSPFLGGVPGLLGRAATLADRLDAATRDGLVLAPEAVAAIGHAEARRNRWTGLALWVIAALLAVVIWKLV
jgi:hypothetical protein